MLNLFVHIPKYSIALHAHNKKMFHYILLNLLHVTEERLRGAL